MCTASIRMRCKTCRARVNTFAMAHSFSFFSEEMSRNSTLMPRVLLLDNSNMPWMAEKWKLNCLYYRMYYVRSRRGQYVCCSLYSGGAHTHIRIVRLSDICNILLSCYCGRWWWTCCCWCDWAPPLFMPDIRMRSIVSTSLCHPCKGANGKRARAYSACVIGVSCARR